MANPLLAEAFKKAKDIDFDLRFMAAKDLCEALDGEKSGLSEEDKVRVLEVFIGQLDDGNKEVRSHAVRCIAKTLYRINEASLKKVIDKIFENFRKEDIDIYALCLKTIVNNIDLSFAASLCSNSVPHLAKYITAKPHSDAAVEQSLDILNAIIRKFGQTLRQTKSINDQLSSPDLHMAILGRPPL
jgi:HEAT repeat protein